MDVLTERSCFNFANYHYNQTITFSKLETSGGGHFLIFHSLQGRWSESGIDHDLQAVDFMQPEWTLLW